MSRIGRALALLSLVVVAAGCSTRGGETPSCATDYEPCLEGHECPGGSSCVEIDWRWGNGSMCTSECDDALDCPSRGEHLARCLDVRRDGTFRCYQSCDRTEDCPGGHVCQPLSTGGGACLP